MRSFSTGRATNRLLGSLLWTKRSFCSVGKALTHNASFSSALLHSQAETPSESIRDNIIESDNHTNKILILKPEDTEDKKFNRLVEDVNARQLRAESKRLSPYSIIKEDLLNDSKQSYIRSIDEYRPPKSSVTLLRYNILLKGLVSSFTKSQIIDYINVAYSNSNFRQKRKGLSNKNKKGLAQIVIEDLWLVKKLDKSTSLDDLYVKKSVKLAHRDLFLLVLENGLIIQYLSRVGVDIGFDPKLNEIQFTGTESLVNNAEIILSAILGNCYKEELNLGSIKRLFLEKYNQFPLDYIGKMTEVFFKHLENDNYELISLNINQIRRCKRLLLWLLNYNQHSKEKLKVPNIRQGTSLLPYKDDDSLSWDNRHIDFFTLRSDSISITDNEALREDLDKYSDLNLTNDDMGFDKIIEDSKISSFQNMKDARDLENETLNVLQDLGFSLPGEIEEDSSNLNRDEELTLEAKRSMPKIASIEKETLGPRLRLSIKEKDEIYSFLADFGYREYLNGLESDKLNNPIFTVTPGLILFQNDKQENGDDNVIPLPAKLECMPYKFTSQVSLINDKVLTFPLYDSNLLTNEDFNKFLDSDPHNYTIQMKFLPTPFNEATLDKEKIKFPPIEIWIDLNSRGKPDLETINIVTVEGENNYYVSAPEYKADFKVCCQISGDILSGDDFSQAKKVDETDLLSVLNSTTSKYSKFESQPGISKFLAESVLDFGGKVAPSISPSIDLIINGQSVKYHYINVSYRRQLDLSFKNEKGDEKLVQFNVVEGGSLGGRKLEVNLVGNLNENLDRQAFYDLLDDASDLISQL
ncbi:uncharacterized protein PRCAT00001301001 [Priceomyces carsonii]|uniref:uncharacterized protein n=1 Tax=Priceomyces carsonii TaxID=28549 RepID=UPI002EDB47A3|nr:unnamed protein product [Priceomyces carsonii]